MKSSGRPELGSWDTLTVMRRWPVAAVRIKDDGATIIRPGA